jgi:hypothetical protein
MGKIKIGSVNHQNIVKGDANLLKQGEILVSTSEGYTILRKRDSNGKIKTFVVIPLEDFKNDKEVSTKTKSKDVDINPENIEGD